MSAIVRLLGGLPILAAILLPLQASAIEGEVVALRDTGPAENRVDLVIVAEGYTAEQQELFVQDAENLVEGIFTFEPWASYANLINVKLLKVVSNEDGADSGTRGGERDTAFDATYWCNGIERLLCVNEFKVLRAVGEHVPEYDYAAVLVNDGKYGGSGGIVAVASLHEAALLILVHEIAHQIANLADEYEAPYPGFPECPQATDCPEPNVTIRTRLEELKWAAWVEEGMPIPSPDHHPGVGLFEGARFKSKGVYRPQWDCSMRSYGSRDLCPVCNEAHTLAFLRDVSLVEEPRPAVVPPFSTCDEELEFGIEVPVDPERVRITWALGDRVIATDRLQLRLPRSAFAPGENALEVVVEHLTSSVRNDPDGELVDSYVFVVEGGTCGEGCTSEVRCDEEGCAVDLLPDGTPCGAASCSDGVLQGAICRAGACEEGTFECAPYACDPEGHACATSCTSDADCAGGRCVDGACVQRIDGGAKRKRDDGGCSGSAGPSAISGALALAALVRRRRR